MLLLAALKGIAQGYIVTAPAMLVMSLVGKEASLGSLLSVGGVLSAFLLYIVGRTTSPRHRIYLFTSGLLLFAAGAMMNALLFDRLGVLLFLLLMVLGRPLGDIAYFTIQMSVIDTVSAIERRNQYAYIVNQEVGFFAGRILGCGLFILLAWCVSNAFALRYAPAVGCVHTIAVDPGRAVVVERLLRKRQYGIGETSRWIGCPCIAFP